jgi:trans-aconitate methyltransferase
LVVSTSVAENWVQRWDAQQERYVADREERFRVVADVVRWACHDRPASVVDLGCGPGSLSSRLVATLPQAQVIGLDADPVLLELARQQGVTTARVDLADPSWADAVPFTDPWDAAVSSTALHWLEIDALAQLYRTVAQRLRPGGVFVDADHRAVAGPGSSTAELGHFVRTARAERAGVTENEEWGAWWEAVLADPALAAHVDARSEVSISHDGNTGLTVGQQLQMLREAGFAEATTVWQSGDDYVVVGIR